MKVVIYFDGASSNNGRSNQSAGIGVVAYRNGKKIWEKSKPIGNKTNNQAEWLAFIEALRFVVENQRNYETYIIAGDSKLVIEQFNGRWRIKDAKLLALNHQAKELFNQITASVTVQWIPRKKNPADSLAKKSTKRRT